MMYFKAQSGDIPCTTDFKYKRMKASEFMSIHGIDEINSDFEDFDIFFIDTEGFSTINGVSEDLFLGMFSLLGGVSVQMYLDQTPMTDIGRVKCLVQNLTVSSFLGSEHPKKQFLLREMQLLKMIAKKMTMMAMMHIMKDCTKHLKNKMSETKVFSLMYCEKELLSTRIKLRF